MQAVAITEGNGSYVAVYPYGHIRASQIVYNHFSDPEVNFTFLNQEDALFWLSLPTVDKHIAFLKAAARNVLEYLGVYELDRLN